MSQVCETYPWKGSYEVVGMSLELSQIMDISGMNEEQIREAYYWIYTFPASQLMSSTEEQ